MGSPVERRQFRAELELRHAGRTVCGVVCPFDEPTDVGGYRESFTRGAFTRTCRERGARVKLLAQHDRDRLPVGRATLLREDPAGLYGEFAVSRTTAGDEVLELVRDGVVTGMSIGFQPVRDRWDSERSAVERLEVKLVEVSLTPWPAYDGARVLAVRDDRPRIAHGDAAARLAAFVHPTPPEVASLSHSAAVERLHNWKATR